MTLNSPLFELGDKVVEAIGPESIRIERDAVIVGIATNGNCRTDHGTYYDEMGLATPKAKNRREWRSIRHR